MAAEVRVQLVEPTREFAAQLAPLLRADDVRECIAASGEGPLASLYGSLARSTVVRACTFDGEPAAMWGVAPVQWAADTRPVRPVAVCWLLGGEVLEEHPWTFWKLCRPGLAELAVHFPVLFNYVDARYQKCLRWARALGFEVLPAQPFGTAGLPFHPIVFRSEG